MCLKTKMIQSIFSPLKLIPIQKNKKKGKNIFFFWNIYYTNIHIQTFTENMQRNAFSMSDGDMSLRPKPNTQPIIQMKSHSPTLQRHTEPACMQEFNVYNYMFH